MTQLLSSSCKNRVGIIESSLTCSFQKNCGGLLQIDTRLAVGMKVALINRGQHLDYCDLVVYQRLLGVVASPNLLQNDWIRNSTSKKKSSRLLNETWLLDHLECPPNKYQSISSRLMKRIKSRYQPAIPTTIKQNKSHPTTKESRILTKNLVGLHI